MINSAPDLAAALAERPLVLDGGLSTELERRGHDISGRLWSARLLNDAPEAVVDVHSSFLRAGASVITTASYQGSTEGFVRAGFTAAEGAELLRRSVRLAQRARHEFGGGSIWVAGSVGPYGAMLADGSEYSGDYGPGVDRDRLRRFHRPRLEILIEAGVDVLAAETVPSLLEAEALALELAELDRPAWLSLTTTTDADGVVRTRRGEPAAAAFALAAEVKAIVAVGINCTDPRGVPAAIAIAAEASGKPVVVYPNSGETWNAAARSWTGPPSAGFGPAQTERWLNAGARLIGGCCRVGPEMIKDVASTLADRPR